MATAGVLCRNAATTDQFEQVAGVPFPMDGHGVAFRAMRRPPGTPVLETTRMLRKRPLSASRRLGPG